MIYLDFQASTPVPRKVLDAMEFWYMKNYSNPSSSHLWGVESSEAIQQVRNKIADEIGASPSEIIFTSGATESNNVALKGDVFDKLLKGVPVHIITSSIEHKCILNICSYLEEIGARVTYLKPGINGVINVGDVENAIDSDTALVSLIHVNNELGTINPIQEIGELCFDKNIHLHSDAAQSFCKLKIDVDESNISLLSITAHKIGGPKGVGALYIKDAKTRNITPVVHGAGQELGIRGGTLATPLIVGFGEAIEISKIAYKTLKDEMLVEYLKSQLTAKDIKYSINGENALRVSHCINILFHNIDVQKFIRKYENYFCVSQGSACSSHVIEPSHVLSAIGLDRMQADQSIRISFDSNTNKHEINSFIEALSMCKEWDSNKFLLVTNHASTSAL